MDPWASAALSVAATRARARLDCDDELEDKDKIDDAFKNDKEKEASTKECTF